MNPSPRRRALARIGTLLGSATAVLMFPRVRLLAAEPAEAAPREIPIVAQRFFYTPNSIPLKRGEPVVLAFTSLDFVHGFHAPDFGVRADLLPGTVTRVALTAKETGTFTFLCDNFCGDGHEQMSGEFIVT